MNTKILHITYEPIRHDAVNTTLFFERPELNTKNERYPPMRGMFSKLWSSTLRLLERNTDLYLTHIRITRGKT